MIKSAITNLLSELSKYHRSRSDIMYDAVANRLDRSLEAYSSELSDSFKYLQYRKPDKLMRKLSK